MLKLEYLFNFENNEAKDNSLTGASNNFSFSFANLTPNFNIEEIKREFFTLLRMAKADTEDIAKDTALKLERWMHLRANGEIDSDDFVDLVMIRKRVIAQFLNTKEIQIRVRLSNILYRLLDIAMTFLIKELEKRVV